MTTAPQRPYEHGYLGDENPWELIPSRFGVLERWRVAALQTGEIGGLTALADHVKNDAVAALDEIEQRERVVGEREAACDARDRAFKDAAAEFFERATPFVERAEQARADQERQAEPEKLATPPGAENDAALPGDPSDPSDLNDLPAPPPPGDDTHVPSADLHALPPKDPEQYGGQQDARGEFLRHPGSAHESEFPNPTLARPPAQQQPVAVGLDRS